MEEDRIAVVRSVISPTAVIEDAGLHLKILDLEQEKLARASFGGHRLVYGPTGTGKTIMLVSRAKLIADDGQKRVLVLCFNVLLAEWLKGRFAECTSIEVRAFHAWGARHGITFQDYPKKVDYGLGLQDALMNGGRNGAAFDAIFIDEGQEFPKEWFECVMLALKDRVNSDLFIAGDGAQSPANKNFTWKSIGIIVNKGDRTRRPKKIYRCTNEIYDASLIPLRKHLRSSKEDIAFYGAERGIAMRYGPKPALIRLRDREEECRLAAALVESWLLGGFECKGKPMRVEPHDIAVLYPFRAGQLSQVFERFQERLSQLCPVSLLERKEGNGSVNDKNLKLLKIQSSKGLQFRHVILLWTDFLPKGRFDDGGGDAYTWLHVAMTRAEFSLTILHSQEWEVLSEIEEHLNLSL